MKWFLFPAAVVATSLALVVVLAMIFAQPARTALASTLGVGNPAGNGPWAGAWATGAGYTLPPELQGLANVPPDQRFSHFVGAQISLKDKNNQPLTITVTPGTVRAASATSLTLAANDGTTKTFTLNDQTMLRGQHVASGSPADHPIPVTGDAVVVVTLNQGATQSATAMAVIDGGPHGFSWSGPDGPRGTAGTGN